MGNKKITRPRGTRDFGPDEMNYRRNVEIILRRVAKTYGYREIATPTFEHLDLFTMKSGEEVVGQLYTFEDKGKRTMALRPELTAAVMRFFAEDMAFEPKPVKIFYFGNCFRYERPQKGRYREFWQFGAESIGPDSPEAAAEIIALASDAISMTGLEKFVLRVGHLNILRGILGALGINDKKVMILIDKGNLAGLKEYLSDQGIPNVQVLIDILELKGDEQALVKARDIIESFSEACATCNKSDPTENDDDDQKQDEVGQTENRMTKAVDQMRTGLEELAIISKLLAGGGIYHIIDFGIARGLDYYTGMVFEVDVPSLGAEKQVCGGGVYNLNELFNLKIKGTSGFAIGFDRLILALEQEGEVFEPDRPVIGILPTPGTEEIAFSISSSLRALGIPTELEVMGRGLKKGLSRMNDLGVAYTIILGATELEANSVIIREMKDGNQHVVTLKELEYFLIQQFQGHANCGEGHDHDGSPECGDDHGCCGDHGHEDHECGGDHSHTENHECGGNYSHKENHECRGDHSHTENHECGGDHSQKENHECGGDHSQKEHHECGGDHGHEESHEHRCDHGSGDT